MLKNITLKRTSYFFAYKFSCLILFISDNTYVKGVQIYC